VRLTSVNDVAVFELREWLVASVSHEASATGRFATGLDELDGPGVFDVLDDPPEQFGEQLARRMTEMAVTRTRRMA